MVTRILFDPRRDLTDGTTSSSPVILEATSTGIREDGSIVVLPTTLSFTVNTAADVVQLAPPAASWAWRITARQDGVVKQQRTVRFADVASIQYQKLTDVDPRSLAETRAHSRQWDATFFQLVGIIAALSDRVDALEAEGGGTPAPAVVVESSTGGVLTLSGSGVTELAGVLTLTGSNVTEANGVISIS